MKRLFYIVALASIVMLPLGASAQEHVNKAIDAFGTAVEKNGIKSSTVDKGNTKAYAKIYEFSLPKKQEKNLEPLKNAFYQDMSAAYDVFVKKETDAAKSNRLIAYGDHLEKLMHLGWPYCKWGRNYLTMCVDDTADSLYRYVYGLEWQKRGKNIEGKVYKLYSMNPKKMSAKQKRSAQNLDGVLKNLEDLSDKLDSIDDDDDDDDSFDLGDLSVLSGLGDLGKLAKAFGGKIVDGTDTIETKEGKTILKSNRQRIVIEKDGSMTIDDGEGNVMKIGADGNVKGMQQSASKPLVGSNTDPIQQFGNLRAAYLNNLRDNIDNTNLLTGLANSILDLCKQKGSVMTMDERALCIDGMKELQERTPDKYIKGIFNVATNSLKKISGTELQGK